ncbi:conserved hypothetical protein [Bradyrhizobium sp. ORS 278]|nr:conserved hypothetical protein [Bradyrhizobium sp. ORS 278]
MAGSIYDDWNTLVANQALNSAWYPSRMDAEQRRQTKHGLLCFLSGIEPKDQFEGMLAAQLLASHNAAMECYRRAMLPEQSFEGRRETLSQANKLSRTYATLLEALNRHRGKGQQKVTVEHVHIHDGGQAIVGSVEGGGTCLNAEEQPHALRHATGQTLRREDEGRQALPFARNGKR